MDYKLLYRPEGGPAFRLVTFMFFCMAISYTYGQTSKPVKINWSESPGILPFEEAQPDMETNLPRYFKLIPIQGHSKPYARLEGQKWKEASEKWQTFLEKNKKIPNNFIHEVKIQTRRKQEYISINMLPVREGEDGKIYLLEEFSINLQEKSVKKLKTTREAYTRNSVLSTGKWVKIEIKESGIYKLNHEDIKEMGFSDPSKIRLFGNGGKQIPWGPHQETLDDLKENAIWMEKGSDNSFGEGDYILFYAEGPVTWKYDSANAMFVHHMHDYANASYYFLTTDVGTGKKIQTLSSSDLPYNKQVNSFDDYAYHEENYYNMIGSGREWYGEEFDLNTSYSFPFNFPDLVTSDSLKVKIKAISHSEVNGKFTFLINNKQVGELTIPSISNYGTTTGTYANPGTSVFPATANTPTFILDINYSKPQAKSKGYLDFITVNARRDLRFSPGQTLAFRDTRSAGNGNTSQFLLENANESVQVWEITEITNVKKIATRKIGTKLSFQLQTETLREFIAFPGSGFKKPKILGEIENQNLHSHENLDYVIVSHPDFLKEAERLGDFHEKNHQLKVAVVTTVEVYNEFSSGKPSAGAIRDYMKMLYDRGADETSGLKYLLLFGDGSYDNKTDDPGNTNFIPTYQSSNSLDYAGSYVTDDFFGLLDEGEDVKDGLVDIGIGRFPVSGANEASNMVDKVIAYHQESVKSDWRNQLCFIGDDEDGNTHMKQANDLAQYVQNKYPVFNINKIFLDAFPQVSTSVGEKYPDVNQSINNQVRKGALIMNYTGHGGELGLAHEQILGVDEINSWDNMDKLPLFVTATCEFSRFDDMERTSAGEKVLLNHGGGGIALLTTTRVVYAHLNFDLNLNFYKVVFENDNSPYPYRLGDITRLTKNQSAKSINKRNFTLLGDPAVQLTYPKHKVITDSINGIPVSSFSDTLKALSITRVSGHLENQNGQSFKRFNGILYPTVFDKPSEITTLQNDGGTAFQFKIRNSILYKGKASVKNGRFSFEFILPKDISYQFGPGKVSYYGVGNQEEACGYMDTLTIGGSAEGELNDSTGPEIELYMNDENFVYGGITDESPYIYAVVKDSNGINTSGNGIGHDITAILDNNTNNVHVLNDYYEADLNTYKSGKVKYRLSDLKPGNHSLKLKVWDIVNNSSEQYTEFVVAESAKLALKRVLNYPNPFTERTAFYFEHNHPGEELDLLIQVFTVSGKLVKSIETTLSSTGFREGPFYWDGLDDFGDQIGRGVYIYRVKLRGQDNQVAEKYEKLVILK